MARDFKTRPTVNGSNLALTSEVPTVPTRYDFIRFFEGGTLAVATGVGHEVMFSSGTIDKIKAKVNVAPTGASIVLSLRKNGVEQTTLTIAAGSTLVTASGLNITFVEDDSITLNITQVGSTVAGSSLTVKARYTY